MEVVHHEREEGEEERREEEERQGSEGQTALKKSASSGKGAASAAPHFILNAGLDSARASEFTVEVKSACAGVAGRAISRCSCSTPKLAGCSYREINQGKAMLQLITAPPA